MWSTIALLVSVVAPPGASISCIPDAANSTVAWHDASSACGAPLLCSACQGPATIDVTVHDQFNVPMAGLAASRFWAETDGALGDGTPCAQTTRISASASTDGSGRTTIAIGGAGGASRVLRVMTDYKVSIVLGSVAFRSADGTGDLLVDLADLGLLAQNFNRVVAGSPLDLNCDAAINLADLGFLADHYNHGCR
jgi:hypothetical protein